VASDGRVACAAEFESFEFALFHFGLIVHASHVTTERRGVDANPCSPHLGRRGRSKAAAARTRTATSGLARTSASTADARTPLASASAADQASRAGQGRSARQIWCRSRRQSLSHPRRRRPSRTGSRPGWNGRTRGPRPCRGRRTRLWFSTERR
jgi:hypothetical protein